VVSQEFSLEEGEFLVRIARKAVEKYLQSNEMIRPPPETSKKLWRKYGVFVTIEKMREINGRVHKELRGCIGFPLPIKPLIEAAIEAAIAAAVEDPRFPPLQLSELNDVVFEVSILTPPSELKPDSPKDFPKLIKVGRDGLIVEYGFYRGLLLPQVPIEYGWDEETFLSQTCLKAGLPPDCWLYDGIKIYSFQAEIFCEEEPNGRVVRRKLSEHRGKS